MITFEWRIKSLTPGTIDGIHGVATQVDFELIAHDTETGEQQGIHGAYTPPMDALDEGFVPYEELTPGIVTGWLEAMPAAETYKEDVAAALREVQAAATLPVLPALPWDPQ